MHRIIHRISFDANGTLFRVHPSVGHNYVCDSSLHRGEILILILQALVAQKYKIPGDPQGLILPSWLIFIIHFPLALTKAFMKSWMVWNQKAEIFGLRAVMSPEKFWQRYMHL